jgi:hypothetical protein
MPLDRGTVSRWLEAYVRAWETHDPHAIGELFAEDATYAWHPCQYLASRLGSHASSEHSRCWSRTVCRHPAHSA